MESLTFVLPNLPKSINSLYQINFRLRTVSLKDEVRIWKSESKGLIPAWNPVDRKTGFISVKSSFTYNFYYQNGKLRQFDTPNMLKALYDLIAEKIGVDDKYLKEGAFSSTHSEEIERVEVEVRFV